MQTRKGIFIIIILILLQSCRTVIEKPKPPTMNVAIDPFRLKVADSLKHLIPILDSVYYYDQLYRVNNNTKLLFQNKNKQKRIDSINLLIVDSVIRKYGILGMNDIGIYGHMAITMTIQHSDIETQKKYLPEFKKALGRKKIGPVTYAMLEDRVLVKSGKMQIYGTQVMVSSKNKIAELLPVVSPDSIDIRRKSIGLIQPISDYLKQFGIAWNLEEYKKQLPGLKIKHKIID